MPATDAWTQLVDFDIFPKMDQSYKQKTSEGGLLTLILGGLMSLLFLPYTFIYSTSGDLQIHLDIHVAMECQYLLVHVQDAGGAMLSVNSEFAAVETLQPYTENINRRTFRNKTKAADESILNIHDMIDHAHIRVRKQFQIGSAGGDGVKGCRLVGSLSLNKVSGSLHVTAQGHGFGGYHTAHEAINFTHQINKLQFGEHFPGIINPLDESAQSSDEPFTTFSYFVSVVPTIFVDRHSQYLLTNQYAVTEFARKWDHSNPSKNQGAPGVFIHYSIEPILVRIQEKTTSFTQFVIGTCGIFGGMWKLVGIAYSVLTSFPTTQSYSAIKPKM